MFLGTWTPRWLIWLRSTSQLLGWKEQQLTLSCDERVERLELTEISLARIGLTFFGGKEPKSIGFSKATGTPNFSIKWQRTEEKSMPLRMLK